MRSLLILVILLSSSVSFAGPSCSVLNDVWSDLHNALTVMTWDNSSFDCPSQQSNVASVFYYLDTIEIIDPNTQDPLFDYSSYVLSQLTLIVRGNPGESRTVGGAGAIAFGSGIYDSPRIGIESPAGMVHERKHFDDGRKHVMCTVSNLGRNCDGKFHMMSAIDDDFDTKIENPDVGAYSLTIAYLSDFYNYGQGHDLAQSSAQYFVRYYMANTFNPRSSSNPEGLTNQQLVQALSRVDAQ